MTNSEHAENIAKSACVPCAGSSPASSDAVVRSRDAATAQVAAMGWPGWTGWWATAAEEMAQHHESFEWMRAVGQSSASPGFWPGKGIRLCQRMLAAALSGVQQGTRLTLDHQRAALHLWNETAHAWQSGSPVVLQSLAGCGWPGVADFARNLSLIALCQQAALAGAWADFWSLPAAESAEN